MADSPRSVIIVDDDRAVRCALARTLTGEGYQVLEAPSGLRLLSLLQVDQPDLILLDVTMSWIDGFELCRALKANRVYRAIPVVFISGRSAPEDVEAGICAGADGYFQKPIDTSALLERIRQILEHGSSEKPSPSIDGPRSVR